jgi:hypothetical protein
VATNIMEQISYTSYTSSLLIAPGLRTIQFLFFSKLAGTHVSLMTSDYCGMAGKYQFLTCGSLIAIALLRRSDI